MKKLLSVLFAVLLTLLLTACGGDEQSGGSGEGVTDISVLMGKPEVAEQFEAMVKEFNNTHDDISVTVIPLAGQNAYEKMTSLYASGNAPTVIMMGQEFSEFQDRLLDLSEEEWVQEALEGTLDFVTVDEKVYGMPVTVEAFAYIYNQNVLDKAGVNPEEINTRDSLEKALQEVSALDSTLGGIHISSMDWSLGAHFTNVFFAAQSDSHEERMAFMEKLKAGEVNLNENKVYQGWLDTFEMTMEYNSAKDAPLTAQYDLGPLQLGNGEVGFWFMGNWAYPQLAEVNADVDYGFVPVPISNDPNDYGNNQISVGVPSYWTIDASQSTEAEQKAAKSFLNWMVTSEAGKDYYVNELNFIPVFKNIELEPKDNLSRQILKYLESGETLEWMNLQYPPDAFPSMGAALQKFMAGEIDRQGLTEEIENYWKNVE